MYTDRGFLDGLLKNLRKANGLKCDLLKNGDSHERLSYSDEKCLIASFEIVETVITQIDFILQEMDARAAEERYFKEMHIKENSNRN